jgi:hypothetical protein
MVFVLLSTNSITYDFFRSANGKPPYHILFILHPYFILVEISSWHVHFEVSPLGREINTHNVSWGVVDA